MRTLRDWFQHVLGIAGQVAAAVPQVLMTVYLARRDSLESAGHFTVATGLAAAAFTIAAWGFVPHMVLERFRRFPAPTYLAARGIALGVVGLATLAAGMAMFPEISLTIVLAVIALRGADAVIELHFGFEQVWSGPERALRLHAGLHSGKLALLAVVILIAGLWPAHSPDRVILAGAVTACALAIAVLLARHRLWSQNGDASHGVSALFAQASWYGVAAVFCAIVTNLPRLSLPLAYSGEALGVAGVTLTITTFFGMTFYTVWVRHFSLLAKNRLSSRVVAFARELLLLGLLCAIACIWPLPQIAAWLFDFDSLRFGGEVRGIMLASVAFFAGMSLLNLYKLGQRPWCETLGYSATIAFGIAVGVTVFPQTGLMLPMLGAGILMVAMSIPALRNAIGITSRANDVG
jgi:hypothetical protein